ncbi:hypothetical protein BMS3Bbin04_00206 [bacterium BMS3Bbin04]|nr:hypothetical protein BMS3Bbin04_00206 [bacterium BMS3Bbin04]
MTVTHTVGVLLDLDQVALFFKVGDHSLTGCITIKTDVLLRCWSLNTSFGVENDRHLKTVTTSHLKVVRVMGRGDFYRASPELTVHIIIGDDCERSIA